MHLIQVQFTTVILVDTFLAPVAGTVWFRYRFVPVQVGSGYRLVLGTVWFRTVSAITLFRSFIFATPANDPPCRSQDASVRCFSGFSVRPTSSCFVAVVPAASMVPAASIFCATP